MSIMPTIAQLGFFLCILGLAAAALPIVFNSDDLQMYKDELKKVMDPSTSDADINTMAETLFTCEVFRDTSERFRNRVLEEQRMSLLQPTVGREGTENIEKS